MYGGVGDSEDIFVAGDRVRSKLPSYFAVGTTDDGIYEDANEFSREAQSGSTDTHYVNPRAFALSDEERGG